MVNTKDERINEEIIRNVRGKTETEKILTRDNINLNSSNNKYLGIDKDRILFYYSIKQLNNPKIFTQISKDINGSKIKKGIINGVLYDEVIMKIVKLLNKNNIPFSIVQNPDYETEIGLQLLKE